MKTAAVPNSEDNEGNDATLSNTLEDIRQRISTTDLQTLLDELGDAAFQFLANATPTDARCPSPPNSGIQTSHTRNSPHATSCSDVH